MTPDRLTDLTEDFRSPMSNSFAASVRNDRVADRVSCVVLLAGRVRRSKLSDAAARSLLDLPVDETRSVLDLWAERLREFAAARTQRPLLVRVAIDHEAETPRLPTSTADDSVRFEVARDPATYRGTAGVVRDLTHDIAPDAHVLVATASLVPTEPLERALSIFRDGGEGICIAQRDSGDAAGLYLIRRRRLRDVPDVGFVDLKEQAFSSAAASVELRVARRPSTSVLPMRTLDEYVGALRALRATKDGLRDTCTSPFAEQRRSVFNIVEPGAVVAPSAVLQDSVVLSGGIVEDNAVVARSVVGPGGVVGRSRTVIETVIAESAAR